MVTEKSTALAASRLAYHKRGRWAWRFKLDLRTNGYCLVKEEEVIVCALQSFC